MFAFLHATELTPRVRNALEMRYLLLSAVACTVAAIVLALATAYELLDALAITLGGTAFVLLVCAAFLAVGQSEDRARARDAAERERQT
jgi:hypothetical protein